MADNEVRLTIRVQGPAPIVVLHFGMLEEDVQVLSRHSERSADTRTHVDVLQVAGTGAAIRLAPTKWRRRCPDKKVKIVDENGEPLVGYL